MTFCNQSNAGCFAQQLKRSIKTGLLLLGMTHYSVILMNCVMMRIQGVPTEGNEDNEAEATDNDDWPPSPLFPLFASVKNSDRVSDQIAALWGRNPLTVAGPDANIPT
ncbi:MAG: hypothetical protein ISR85_03710 [Kiritimatiellales bacterium]|nr:hypothetical protein [Kiritimatiellales bacterium]